MYNPLVRPNSALCHTVRSVARGYRQSRGCGQWTSRKFTKFSIPAPDWLKMSTSNICTKIKQHAPCIIYTTYAITFPVAQVMCSCQHVIVGMLKTAIPKQFRVYAVRSETDNRQLPGALLRCTATLCSLTESPSNAQVVRLFCEQAIILVYHITALTPNIMGTVATNLLLDDVATSSGLRDPQDDHGAQTRVTEFHCTAFGKFHNVAVNPTELLLRSLPSYFSGTPLPPCAKIASATVLEVAARPTRTLLERMHEKVTPRAVRKQVTVQSQMAPIATPESAAGNATKGRPGRVVFVHFGVNVSVRRCELEMQGFNEATFTCPDEAGWSPVKVPINPDSSLPLAHALCTKLPLLQLARTLQTRGFDVGVSKDAGRFVCNFVYYNSLRLAEKSGSLVLFVHVPALEVMPLERQLAFCSTLLSCIAELES